MHPVHSALESDRMAGRGGAPWRAATAVHQVHRTMTLDRGREGTPTAHGGGGNFRAALAPVPPHATVAGPSASRAVRRVCSSYTCRDVRIPSWFWSARPPVGR